MKVKLSVYKNEQLQAEIEIDGADYSADSSQSEIFIGRAKDCHLVLDHPHVSRHHASLKRTGKSWEIHKLSEFGNILINGTNIDQKREINNGDILSINPFFIHVFVPQAGPEPRMPVDDLTSSMVHNGPSINPVHDNDQNTRTEDFRNLSNDDFDLKNGDFQDEKEKKESVNSQKGHDERNGGVGENDLGNSSEEGENKNEPLDGGSSENDPFGGESSNFGSDSNENSGGLGGESKSENMFGEDGQSHEGFGDGFSNLGTDPENNDSSGQNQLVADDDYGDDKTRAMMSFAQYSLKLFGENAPYDEYAIKDPETFIGRDKTKCQIVLDDPEVSTVHAVLKKTKISLVLVDLDSSNGTILNGSRINQSELQKNDEFIIGSTTFTVTISSDLLQVEDGRLMPVEDNQEVLVEEIVEEEVDFAGNEGQGNDGISLGEEVPKNKSLFSKDALKDPAKRKKLIYIVVGFLVLMLLLGEEEKPKDAKGGKKDEKNAHALKKDQQASNGVDDGKNMKKKKLTPEEKEYLEGVYQLAKTLFEEGNYKEAEFEINKIYEVTSDGYKESGQLRALISEGYKRIQAQKEKEERELAEKMRKKQIEDLVEKAKEAVKEKRVELAEGLFVKILELDPEQSDVSLLKMELEAWRKEKERKELEKVQKEAERKRKVEALVPGKTYYLKKQWFKAINKLEEFLKIRDMDEDLIKEATTMLEESKNNMSKKISPLVGKARSLKEGQDLKGAYELYVQVLDIDPTHLESLNEINNIKDTLENRLKKIYREAIIAESLSLFNDAKEKFQEVQQLSPLDNDYYKKATEKLKNYLE